MDNAFKNLLLKIAKLPLSDQRWILNQFTTEQQALFDSCQGSSLLEQARRFRLLPDSKHQPIKQNHALPDYCQELSKLPPLYIAILLEQGQFAWEAIFLEVHQLQHTLPQIMQTHVALIKPATKTLLFKQWQAGLNFKDHLELCDG